MDPLGGRARGENGGGEKREQKFFGKILKRVGKGEKKKERNKIIGNKKIHG